jgi:hypothetical protein
MSWANLGLLILYLRFPLVTFGPRKSRDNSNFGFSSLVLRHRDRN